jgi:hypothetical protein
MWFNWGIATIEGSKFYAHDGIDCQGISGATTIIHSEVRAESCMTSMGIADTPSIASTMIKGGCGFVEGIIPQITIINSWDENFAPITSCP